MPPFISYFHAYVVSHVKEKVKQERLKRRLKKWGGASKLCVSVCGCVCVRLRPFLSSQRNRARLDEKKNLSIVGQYRPARDSPRVRTYTKRGEKNCPADESRGARSRLAAAAAFRFPTSVFENSVFFFCMLFPFPIF